MSLTWSKLPRVDLILEVVSSSSFFLIGPEKSPAGIDGPPMTEAAEAETKPPP